MTNIEYLRLQAKNLFRDYKKQTALMGIDDRELSDKPTNLMRMQHTYSRFFGFSSWSELINASEVEQNLARLLCENRMTDLELQKIMKECHLDVKSAETKLRFLCQYLNKSYIETCNDCGAKFDRADAMGICTHCKKDWVEQIKRAQEKEKTAGFFDIGDLDYGLTEELFNKKPEDKTKLGDNLVYSIENGTLKFEIIDFRRFDAIRIRFCKKIVGKRGKPPIVREYAVLKEQESVKIPNEANVFAVDYAVANLRITTPYYDC